MSSTILIVDDEMNLREILCEIFTMEGFQVHQAKNGLEGLSLLENHAVDFILSDVRMPNLDGIEFLKTVNLRFPKIQVYLFSAYFKDDEKELLTLGASGIFQKPFDFKVLIRTIREKIKNS